MRAAVLTGPGSVEVIEAAPAPLVDGAVRVAVEGCGVCGSNLPVWEGRPWFDYPLAPGNPGHEAWGRIVEGPGAGQRVALLAENAFCTELVVAADRVVPLPPELDGQPFPGEAIGCAFNAARRSDFRAGQTVAVVGVGFLGTLLVALAASAGARVIAVARKQSALQVARDMGAAETVVMDDHQRVISAVSDLTGGAFCERVVEVTGAPWPLDLSGELTGVGGRLVIAGFHQDGLRSVNVQLWNWRGIDVVNAHERDPAVQLQEIRDAVDAVASGRLDPRPLYTHLHPLSEMKLAMDAAAQRPEGFVKALVLNDLRQSGLDTPLRPRMTKIVACGLVKLGFLGVGWIGRDRMRAIVASGLADAALVADASRPAAEEAAAEVGAAVVSADELLSSGVDGVVIATPSALHAAQSVTALENGLAVFCQKPLGRDAAETAAVVEAARAADLLLGVDLSYRHLAATDALRAALPDVGTVYAADLVFHNAYGPDKAWFRDPALSGGGCVIDLGTHLVDLALHLLPGAEVEHVTSRLFAGGAPLSGRTDVVEDFATARIDLAGGTVLTLGCSWNLHAGQEAVIAATFYGTGGAVALTNVGGSFYDFRALRHAGTSSSVLVEPPDDWGGRAAVAWTRRLAAGERFDPAADELVTTAAVLDRVYGR